MRRKLTALFLASTSAFNAHAATWYVFKELVRPDTIYFFDWDTVVKEKNTISVWIKYVNSDRKPEKDGSFSTSAKWKFDCKKRTMQGFTIVTYDKDHALINTNSTASQPFEVVPGSVGESALEVICAPDFFNKNSTRHFPVPSNDVYSFSKTYFSIPDDALPK